MGDFTSGFKEFENKLDNTKKLIGWAIDYSLDEVSTQLIEDAQSRTPIDTGTLFDSWEVRQDNRKTGYSEDSTHSIEVWSNPDIIATNPKHPNGEYYSDKIENGFLMTNGKFYRGRHMFKLAFSSCNRNLKASLKKQLGSVFNEG